MAKFNIDKNSLGSLDEGVDSGLDINKLNEAAGESAAKKEEPPKKERAEKKEKPVKETPKEASEKESAPAASKKGDEKPSVSEPSPEKTKRRRRSDVKDAFDSPALKGFTLKKSVADKLDFISGMEKAMKGASFNQSAYVNSLIEADIDKKLKELGYDKLYADKVKNGK